jgi:GTP pyrophosphokinase
MVPLTTLLKTGQRVEILTAKTAQPSRDWMNPQLNYTVTQRARSAISHWFRMQALELAGNQAEKESASDDKPKSRLRTDIFLAIKNKAQRAAKQLIGIDHLLTKIGRCCKPLPGDAVMGYITRQEGISIHRLDCRNLKRLSNEHQERLLEVNWGKTDESPAYPVDLMIIADDEAAYLRDLTGVLASEKIQIIGLTSQRLADGEVDIKIVLLVNGVQVLNKIMHLIQSLKATRSVRRI